MKKFMLLATIWVYSIGTLYGMQQQDNFERPLDGGVGLGWLIEADQKTESNRQKFDDRITLSDLAWIAASNEAFSTVRRDKTTKKLYFDSTALGNWARRHQQHSKAFYERHPFIINALVGVAATGLGYWARSKK